MAQLKGYAGNILRVDLSTGGIHTTPTESYTDLFLGGRGLAAKIYWDEVPPGSDAFDPENKLIFTTGPVTATTGFAGSRWQVCGKSPIHNQFSYCNIGGAWGAQLKYAGYDALVVLGKADRPVYLLIHDGQVQIKDAVHLTGKGAISCREALKETLGKSTRIVTIGPAGENRVTFSTFLADSDSSGSSGLASVMGSKNLKAIAVKGQKKIDVADKDQLGELKKRVLSLTGTPPTKVFSTSMMVPHERLKPQICYDCTGCPVRASYAEKGLDRGKFMCQSSNFYEVRAHRYYGEYNHVPYTANKLCDDYGLDTHGIETMIMWLTRCRKAGVLTDEQTEMPLSKIGSVEFIETLTRKIAFREGIGDVLASGTLNAAQALGKDAQKLITDYISNTGYNPIYGGRLYLTTGLFWAMEPRLPIQLLHEVSMLGVKWAMQNSGLAATGVTSQVYRAIAERFWGSEAAADFSTYEGKALAAVRIQDRQYAKESLILCDFLWPITLTALPDERVGDPTLESRLCTAVTGMEIDEQGLYTMGERVYNLQRAIHAREGRKGRDSEALEEYNFTVPLKGDFGNPKCMVPGKDGEPFSRKGMVVDRKEFEKMKDEYYEIRGWDVKTGLQTKAKLEDLNLAQVAKTLESEGLLA